MVIGDLRDNMIFGALRDDLLGWDVFEVRANLLVSLSILLSCLVRST